MELIDRTVTEFIYRNQTGTATENILIIQAPPRHGKSEYTSRYLPAWFVGRWPDKRVMLASHEAHYALSWGRKARNVLDEYGEELFGVRVSSGQSSAHDWSITGHEGGMFTAGVGGPFTGRGADLLIIDDYMKNSEKAMSAKIRDSQWDWWESTAYTRVEPGGCAIIVATPWHLDDLTGRLIRNAKTEDGDPVQVLRLPALAEEGDQLGRAVGEPLWPERRPRAWLEKKRAAMQSKHWWHALFQCNPKESTQSEWSVDLFDDHVWCQPEHWPETFELRLLAVDPSKGKNAQHGDYSAIVFVGVREGLLYVDASIERRPVRRIVMDTIVMCDRYRPDMVGFEANAFQELLADEFSQVSGGVFGMQWPIEKYKNMVPKNTRILRLGQYIENRQIRFKADSPGCRLLVNQLMDFPNGDHDDGPDAMEMAVRLPLEFGTPSGRVHFDQEYAVA
ncbi:MAG: phage terminase large subunit [Patescibacteria group bacterium]